MSENHMVDDVVTGYELTLSQRDVHALLEATDVAKATIRASRPADGASKSFGELLQSIAVAERKLRAVI